ncbi:MAG TPA: hypothetical protein VHG91_13710 [Longimicrobium sp.]|nr:hypothetical protein [Longimicrobium sp.]
MYRWSRLVIAVAAVSALTACGSDADTPLAPTAPSYEEGGLIAGGNNSNDPAPTSTGGSTTTESDTTGVSRGGLIAGGN